MAESLFENVYNPDVLSCLANLSNDEVFTPPDIVNQMLDMLPQELFENPDTTFLDPACKTGVFLREIAKRLIKGLEPQIPNLQKRIDHIFHKQLYGIAITELTSLLSRRGLYCSKFADGSYSVSKFENSDGNIRYKRVNHTWENDKCIYCGASKEQYDRGKELEAHAYEFIHIDNPEEIFNMKFDVIIGNPPYQLSTTEQSAQATPLYNKFVESAMNLNPRFLSMIIQSRWFTSGMGLSSFRKKMINNRNISYLCDFPNASDCFPGVEIKGGVCYFLWEREYNGKCKFVTKEKSKVISEKERYLKYKECEFVIRDNEAIEILDKISKVNEKSFSEIVSAISPFEIPSNFSDYYEEKKEGRSKRILLTQKIGYLKDSYKVIKNKELEKGYKVFVPEAIGSGNPKTDRINPIIGEPNDICSATYLIVGPFKTKKECVNVTTYINTKFFHYLLSVLKNTQHTPARTYSFIPMQDFKKSWSDEELFKKYKLTNKEIELITKTVREDIGGEYNG